jgi:GrpB-like predicted nucleotidyltransferase (UPF0157 family)
MKRDMETRFTNDRLGYNDAKGPFIEAALERADQWAARTGWRP